MEVHTTQCQYFGECLLWENRTGMRDPSWAESRPATPPAPMPIHAHPQTFSRFPAHPHPAKPTTVAFNHVISARRLQAHHPLPGPCPQYGGRKSPLWELTPIPPCLGPQIRQGSLSGAVRFCKTPLCSPRVVCCDKASKAASLENAI